MQLNSLVWKSTQSSGRNGQGLSNPAVNFAFRFSSSPGWMAPQKSVAACNAAGLATGRSVFTTISLPGCFIRSHHARAAGRQAGRPRNSRLFRLLTYVSPLVASFHSHATLRLRVAWLCSLETRKTERTREEKKKSKGKTIKSKFPSLGRHPGPSPREAAVTSFWRVQPLSRSFCSALDLAGWA